VTAMASLTLRSISSKHYDLVNFTLLSLLGRQDLSFSAYLHL
jgi:hypothetical protein